MTGAATGDPPRQRLRPEARRKQLLDAAADIVVEQGLGALTMEGIAARSGVNKAIPYRHFENAHAVLVELYTTRVRVLGARVLAAIQAAGTLEERVDAMITAYFDVVRVNGVLLELLRSGTSVTRDAEPELRGEAFTNTLLVEYFGVSRSAAPATGEVIQSILAGAARSWAARHASRAVIQRLAAGACRGVLAAAGAAASDGRR